MLNERPEGLVEKRGGSTRVVKGDEVRRRESRPIRWRVGERPAGAEVIWGIAGTAGTAETRGTLEGARAERMGRRGATADFRTGLRDEAWSLGEGGAVVRWKCVDLAAAASLLDPSGALARLGDTKGSMFSVLSLSSKQTALRLAGVGEETGRAGHWW